jgi:cob(I)alamin adenosyltransferase
MPLEPPTEPPQRPPRRRVPSLLLVYTGDGKGKSTAAFGAVLRAVARDWRVAVVQFMKSGDWNVGEERVCRDLGVEWFAAGDGFTWDSHDLDETRAKAVAAWGFAQAVLDAGEHELVVLDEATYPMAWGWVDTAAVVSALRDRPAHVNVILTGRDAPAAIIEAADTATEMRKLKHAYDSGVRAQRGLDY